MKKHINKDDIILYDMYTTVDDINYHTVVCRTHNSIKVIRYNRTKNTFTISVSYIDNAILDYILK